VPVRGVHDSPWLPPIGDNMKFKERPKERDHERGSKQNRYESGRKIEDDGREKLTLPRPKNPVLIMKMCLYCGSNYPADFRGDSCPKCSIPF
jgi:hypothetical protein